MLKNLPSLRISVICSSPSLYICLYYALICTLKDDSMFQFMNVLLECMCSDCSIRGYRSILTNESPISPDILDVICQPICNYD